MKSNWDAEFKELAELFTGGTEAANDAFCRIIDDAESYGYDEGFSDGETYAYGRSEEQADEWIKYGECDIAVEKRAMEMGMEFSSPEKYGTNERQMLHRSRHPDGPWGVEFCSKCN